MGIIKQEVGIPVGEPCQIQLDHGKHPSFFRGYSYPKYILLDGPTSHGSPVVAVSGAPYVVRFVSGGMVYGYDSMLMKQYTTPVNLWVMRYPDEIQTVNLRKSQRVSTFIPSTLTSAQGDVTGALIDISEGGGLFSSPNRVEAQSGQSAHMDMALPGGERVEGLECKICSIKSVNGKVLLGINFNPRDTANIQKIKSFYLLLISGP